jgi:serine O-acetyltransferase
MGLLNDMWADLSMIATHDPAAGPLPERLLCYPGLWAVWIYRLAHVLHVHHIPLVPRLLTTAARILTGIDIHPAASLGGGLLIDHGVGVVIGETAVVGAGCILFQGVTLGGTGKQTGKRHPTLGRGVFVGAGAKVLGNIRIGDRCRVGAGSVVVKDVPPGCTVVGVPGKILSNASSGNDSSSNNHSSNSSSSSGEKVLGSGVGGEEVDVDERAIRMVYDRVKQMREEMTRIEKHLGLEIHDSERLALPADCYQGSVLMLCDGAGI